MATQRLQVYRCFHCGLTVEILDGSGATPVCCGEDMHLMNANATDASQEKHVPVAASSGSGIRVSVGSAPHPMEPDHYIEWIEVINGSYVNRKYLKPGDKPEAEFYVPMSSKLVVRAYCNKHGLWRGAALE